MPLGEDKKVKIKSPRLGASLLILLSQCLPHAASGKGPQRPFMGSGGANQHCRRAAQFQGHRADCAVVHWRGSRMSPCPDLSAHTLC